MQVIKVAVNFVLNIPKNIGKALIRFYQFFFSFDHSFWAHRTTHRICIYEPSCSQYTYEAVDRFGLIRGSIMGFFRILRCNPAVQQPGLDPVPQKFSIKRNYDV
jgi:putative membrane protein insertion efficiency factor